MTGVNVESGDVSFWTVPDRFFPSFCLWRNHSSHPVPAVPGNPAAGGGRTLGDEASHLLILEIGTLRLEQRPCPIPEMQVLLPCSFSDAIRTCWPSAQLENQPATNGKAFLFIHIAFCRSFPVASRHPTICFSIRLPNPTTL